MVAVGALDCRQQCKFQRHAALLQLAHDQIEIGTGVTLHFCEKARVFSEVSQLPLNPRLSITRNLHLHAFAKRYPQIPASLDIVKHAPHTITLAAGI